MPQTLNVGARSVFVTTVAWVFIVLAVLGVASALVRFASSGSVQAALPAGGGFARMLAAHLPWVTALGLSLALATLAAAIGLLMRLDWARRAFIVVLVVAILANLGGLWLQHEVVDAVVSRALGDSTLPAHAMDALGGFVAAWRVLGTTLTLATCGLLAWAIRRLMSAPVRQEFV